MSDTVLCVHASEPSGNSNETKTKVRFSEISGYEHYEIKHNVIRVLNEWEGPREAPYLTCDHPEKQKPLCHIPERQTSKLAWWLSGKEPACNIGDLGSIPGSGTTLRRKWQPSPVFLPGKSHEQTGRLQSTGSQGQTQPRD